MYYVCTRLLAYPYGPGLAVQPLTFADEPLLGDGLLADVAALCLLERLQLEAVCVDTLQLVRLRGEKEGRRMMDK